MQGRWASEAEPFNSPEDKVGGGNNKIIIKKKTPETLGWQKEGEKVWSNTLQSSFVDSFIFELSLAPSC